MAVNAYLLLKLFCFDEFLCNKRYPALPKLIYVLKQFLYQHDLTGTR